MASASLFCPPVRRGEHDVLDACGDSGRRDGLALRFLARGVHGIGHAEETHGLEICAKMAEGLEKSLWMTVTFGLEASICAEHDLGLRLRAYIWKVGVGWEVRAPPCLPVAPETRMRRKGLCAMVGIERICSEIVGTNL